MRELKELYPRGISKACRIFKTSRSSLSYQSVKNDQVLMDELSQLSKDHPREGFWKFYHRMRNSGHSFNHKRVHRVYVQMGLSIRRKAKKRLAARIKEPLEVPQSFTHTWSIDFMSDVLSNGRSFRSFNVIDDYNREVLFIETDYSLKSSRVIYILRHLVNKYGKPTKIRMDNGPEFVAKLAQEWSQMNDIVFHYIQPGKPTQNAYIERFNQTYRRHVLDAYTFDSLEEVRQETDLWLRDYNFVRPHVSLGGMSPVDYRMKKQNTLLGLRSATLHSAQEGSKT